MAAVQRDGMTIVPLKLYFNEHGKAKLLLGLARGRKKADKRDVEKKRDWQRQKARYSDSRAFISAKTPSNISSVRRPVLVL